MIYLSRDDYEVSCAELDSLVKIARKVSFKNIKENNYIL